MDKNVDFDSLFKNLEESAVKLDSFGSTSIFGFTKDQVRFINVLIENAIKEYHKQLFPDA